MGEIRFTKMHGIGNDYIYLDCINHTPERLADLAVEMSDRHTGVGGDGIILICSSAVADFRMRIFNADGSEAKMCGNASRCVAKFVFERGLTDKKDISLETLSGIKYLHIHEYEGIVDVVTVDMGVPQFTPASIPVDFAGERMIERKIDIDGSEFAITAVSMGNPHGVIFVDSLADTDVCLYGPRLECHEMWPDRADIEFAEILSPSEIKMSVWERGSGETMACGTGACATAVAAALTGRTSRHVTVHLRGGDLDILWNEDDGHVYMTGPAETVFDGVYFRKH